MSTVDKDFADKVVAAKGVLFPEDPFEPPVDKIVKYTNAWGGEAYGLIFAGQNPSKYSPSEFVRNPEVYFERTQA